MTVTDYGEVTGTRDKDYDLLWFTQSCLENALRLDQYIADATRFHDEELRDLFERARTNSIKGAEEAKALLRDRLASPRQ